MKNSSSNSTYRLAIEMGMQREKLKFTLFGVFFLLALFLLFKRKISPVFELMAKVNALQFEIEDSLTVVQSKNNNSTGNELPLDSVGTQNDNTGMILSFLSDSCSNLFNKVDQITLSERQVIEGRVLHQFQVKVEGYYHDLIRLVNKLDSFKRGPVLVEFQIIKPKDENSEFLIMDLTFRYLNDQ